MIGFYDLFVITLNIFKGDASIQEVFRLLSVFTLIYITVFIIKHKNRLEFKFEAYCRLIRLKDYKLRNNNGYIKFKMVIFILLIYISICLVGFSFYLSMGQKFDEKSVSNIINVFIWATYILTPIVAVWVFNDWKDQKKYELKKENSFKLFESILNIQNTLEELMALTQEFRYLKNDEEKNFFGKECDKAVLKYYEQLNVLKSNNNLHHGLVRNYLKDKKIITDDIFSSLDDFFQNLTEMITLIYDIYISKEKDIELLNEAFAEPIKSVAESQIKYRDMINPIITILVKECQPPEH
ncbi:hypothetical protein [Acinetobacter bereziniae]|uniref:hypothetical protein n=1 Tax=Acinetobacter bereziniae TaxID=106648 RepID=UPI0018DE2A25|nr:hypothetical protein [Acinetobacter bereziniae]MBI0393480.1 hypothetical protein [Acinetobacter bereziniae]